MPQRRDDPHTSLCRAFSHPLRVRVLNLLRIRGELCKVDIATVVGRSRAEVSRHLNLLERADLVRSRLEHHFRYYRLAESISPFHQKLIESLSGFEGLPELVEDRERLLKPAQSDSAPRENSLQ